MMTAVLAATTSCNKENPVKDTQTGNGSEETAVNGIVFSSELPLPADDIPTKTEWNGETIVWSADDAIRMAYTCDGVWQNAAGEGQAELYESDKLAESAAVAKFTVPGNFKNNAGSEYCFYAVYPASACTDGQNFSNAPSVAVTIPAVQTPSASSFDSSADLMLGRASETYTGFPDGPVSVTWERMVAHAQLTFKNLNGFAKGIETIRKIELTADTDADMTGTHTADIASGEISEPGENANVITLKGDNLSVDENGSLVAWAAFLPCTVKALKVVVTTNIATYTREIASCNLVFKKNARNGLAVNMDGADRKFSPEELYIVGGGTPAGWGNSGTGIKMTKEGNSFKADVYIGHERISAGDGIKFIVSTKDYNPAFVNSGDNTMSYAPVYDLNNDGKFTTSGPFGMYRVTVDFDNNKVDMKLLPPYLVSNFTTYQVGSGELCEMQPTETYGVFKKERVRIYTNGDNKFKFAFRRNIPDDRIDYDFSIQPVNDKDYGIAMADEWYEATGASKHSVLSMEMDARVVGSNGAMDYAVENAENAHPDFKWYLDGTYDNKYYDVTLDLNNMKMTIALSQGKTFRLAGINNKWSYDEWSSATADENGIAIWQNIEVTDLGENGTFKICGENTIDTWWGEWYYAQLQEDGDGWWWSGDNYGTAQTALIESKGDRKWKLTETGNYTFEFDSKNLTLKVTKNN